MGAVTMAGNATSSVHKTPLPILKAGDDYIQWRDEFEAWLLLHKLSHLHQLETEEPEDDDKVKASPSKRLPFFLNVSLLVFACALSIVATFSNRFFLSVLCLVCFYCFYPVVRCVYGLVLSLRMRLLTSLQVCRSSVFLGLVP